MKQAFYCLVFVCLLHLSYGASEQFVEPTTVQIKSYPKAIRGKLGASQHYTIFHETESHYFLALKEEHDFIARILKEKVDTFATKIDDQTLRFDQAYQLEDDRAYLVFLEESPYPVISTTDDGYRIRYRLGSTQREVNVSNEDFLRSDLILRNPKDAICLIQYPKGGGSGFLLQMDDGLYCITNQHVIAHTGIPEIQLISGKQLTVGDYEFANDRDIARIRILEELPAFTTLSEPDLDESITVLGNSYARGRVTILSGKVTGLNALEIETTAKFVPGNSGSPILSKEDHVIGVATAIDTYAKDDSFAEGTVFEGGRRLGLRIDQHIKWTPVDMDLFGSRNRNLFQIKTFVDELPYAYSEFANTEVEYPILSTDFSNRSLKNWVQFRNTRFAHCIDLFENAKDAGYAEAPDRYDYTAKARLDREAYQANIKKEVTACWTAMRQKLQTKKRSLQTFTPYPDTAYMRDHIARMEYVIDTALDATIRIQKGLAEAR